MNMSTESLASQGTQHQCIRVATAQIAAPDFTDGPVTAGNDPCRLFHGAMRRGMLLSMACDHTVEQLG